MYAPRLEPLPLLALLACGEQPDEPLEAVQEGLAREVALAAGPGVTATLLVAAVASEACATQDGLWAEVEPGDPAPFAETLALALGEPTVVGVERTDARTVALALEGAALLGWSELTLLLDAAGDGEGLSLSASASVDGERVGEAALSVLQGCEDVPRTKGEASWTDAEERRHAITFPLDEGASLALDGAVPWLPSAGDLGWSGAVREVSAEIETEDAAGITVDAEGALAGASWPALVTRQDQSWSAWVPIAP